MVVVRWMRLVVALMGGGGGGSGGAVAALAEAVAVRRWSEEEGMEMDVVEEATAVVVAREAAARAAEVAEVAEAKAAWVSRLAAFIRGMDAARTWRRLGGVGEVPGEDDAWRIREAWRARRWLQRRHEREAARTAAEARRQNRFAMAVIRARAAAVAREHARRQTTGVVWQRVVYFIGQNSRMPRSAAMTANAAVSRQVAEQAWGLTRRRRPASA